MTQQILAADTMHDLIDHIQNYLWRYPVTPMDIQLRTDVDTNDDQIFKATIQHNELTEISV